MLFSTSSHFLVLALVAFGFWLIGFASHSRGRRWRRLSAQQSDEVAVYRAEAEDRVHASARRIGELERDLAALERQRRDDAATITELEARLREVDAA